VTDWSAIVAASERFPAVGVRHGLRLVTDLVRGVDERGPSVAVEVHSDDLRLLMHRFVPTPDGGPWIDALVGILDVPAGELPHPDGWAAMTDALLEHREALEALPVLDERRG
jgi:hypothetical protein